METHACDFIERHRREPFLLFVAFFEPHPPYNGPLNEEHPLDQVDLDASATQTFGADMPLRYRLRQEDQQKRFGTTPMDYRKIKQKYLGLVTEIDRSIGAILSTIERLGLADNTIVVHTSDHGDMMGAHRLFEKGVMFRESACVPYLVHMPGQRRSISIAQPSSHIDFLPTVLHLLGKPAPTQCAGKSRVPLLRGEALLPETIFVEWAPNGEQVKKGTTLASPEEIQQAINESTRAAISPEGWKLCLRDNDKHELYNLRADSGEEHNLYYDRQHGDVIAQLTGEIHRWQELVGDTVKV